jgi:hypothetical protein
MVDDKTTSQYTSSEHDRGPFHPTALDEGLGGWVILLKDLLKRSISTLEEVKMMLISLGFLRAYERQGIAAPAANAPSHVLFSHLYSILAQEIAQLGQLRKSIHDDLVTIELTFLPEYTYEELSERIVRYDEDKADDLDPGVIHGCPTTGDHLASRYVEALRILSAAGLREALKVYVPRKVATSDVEATIGRIVQHIAQDPRRLLEWMELLILLQEQPYCQPERIARWIRKYKEEHLRLPDEAALDDQLRRWIGAARSDERIRQLNERIEQLRELLTPIGSGSPIDPEPGPRAALLQKLSDDGPAGREIRRTLVEMTIDWAERCWKQRRKRVLARVARYRCGDVPDADRTVLNAIHADLFRNVTQYHKKFEEIFSSLRVAVQAIQQRSAILAPNFPRVPRFDRHDGERIEAVLLDLVAHLDIRAIEVINLLRNPAPGEAPTTAGEPPADSLRPGSRRRRELLVEVCFDYTFITQVHSIGPTDEAKTVLVTVPFFWRECPRYFAGVVHEIAHAYIPPSELLALFAPERARWRRARTRWDGDVADILRRTGSEIRALWDSVGIGLHEASLLAEVLADFVALMVVGPHYLYSLLFTIVGTAAIPGDTDTQSHVPLSPFVRIGALLHATRELWPELDRPDRVLGFWREHRLRPILSICNAYFRMLSEPSKDVRERFHVDVYRSEIRILGNALCAIVRQLRKKQQPLATMTAFDITAASDLTSERSKQLVQWATRAGDWITATLRNIPGAIPAKQDTPQVHSKFVHWQGSDIREFVRDNMLHFLWNSVLKRYPEATEAFAKAGLNPDPKARRNQRRRFLEAALWLRTPEFRILLDLLDRAEEPCDRASDADSRPGERGKSEMEEQDVVTVVQVDSFWLDEGAIGKAWEAISEERNAAWVIGDHDFLFMEKRFRGVENLDRSGASLFGLLPESSRYCSLRCVDYIARGQVGTELRQTPSHLFPVGAFIQLRFAQRPPSAEELRKMIEDTDGCRMRTPVLQSLGWDHYALRLDVRDFDTLSTVVANVIAKYQVRYHAMNILYERPERSTPPHISELFVELPHDGGPRRLVVGFSTRLRCKHDRNGRTPLQKAHDTVRRTTDTSPMKELVGPWRPFSVTLQATAGVDNLELRIEVWTTQKHDDHVRSAQQSAAIIEFHRDLVHLVGDASGAFEIQTMVLLPDSRAEQATPSSMGNE